MEIYMRRDNFYSSFYRLKERMKEKYGNHCMEHHGKWKCLV